MRAPSGRSSVRVPRRIPGGRVLGGLVLAGSLGLTGCAGVLGRRVLGGLVLAGSLGLTGCAGGVPDAPPSSAANAPVTPVAVPADGRLLSEFGYRYGPTATFSLPRVATLKAAVDQPDNVSAVLSTPAPAEVYGYLVQALPATGFTIKERDLGSGTLTFVGHGWRGSMTGDATTSAVLLRPE